MVSCTNITYLWLKNFFFTVRSSEPKSQFHKALNTNFDALNTKNGIQNSKIQLNFAHFIDSRDNFQNCFGHTCYATHVYNWGLKFASHGTPENAPLGRASTKYL